MSYLLIDIGNSAVKLDFAVGTEQKFLTLPRSVPDWEKPLQNWFDSVIGLTSNWSQCQVHVSSVCPELWERLSPLIKPSLSLRFWNDADVPIEVDVDDKNAVGSDRLFAALTELDRQIEYSDKEIKTALATVPQKRFNPSRAYLYRPETVPFDKAEGAVSLEYVYAYPPGIPLLVPGEVIDADTIKTVHALCDSGVEITSSGNHLPQFIAVADL